MYEKSTEKVQLKAYIPKELDDKFRQIITQKFPEYCKGQLSTVVTEALELLVRSNRGY